MKKLSKVFGSFEVTHERTADLERFYQALVTIAPTSVSSERAFSIVDGTVDSLCFLQSFFANGKEKKL